MRLNGFLFLSGLLMTGLAASFQGIQVRSEQLHHANSGSEQLVAHNLDQENAHRGSGRKTGQTALAEKQLLSQHVDRETAHRGSGRRGGTVTYGG